MDRAGHCSLGHLLRPPRARRRRRGEPHLLRRARRRRRVEPVLPDIRHHVAGVQRLRRELALHGRPGKRAEPGIQGLLRPPRQHARQRQRRGLRVQRRVPDGPLARAQRLRRVVHDGRRQRSPRCRDPRAQGVPVGRARRVLVRRAAHERGGRSQRGREPRVLQRQRGLLEDPLGGQLPDAGLLQGDAREREARSPGVDLDRHVARPARVQPTGRQARERPHGHDFHGQLRHRRPARAGRRRADAVLARERGGQSAGRRDRDARRRHDRLRVGRGRGQRRAATRPGAPVHDHGERCREAAGLGLELRVGHRDAPSDAVSRHQRRRG